MSEVAAAVAAERERLTQYYENQLPNALRLRKELQEARAATRSLVDALKTLRQGATLGQRAIIDEALK